MISKYSCTNDLLGLRTTKTQNFNNEVKDFDFGYNPRSEVTSAKQTGNTNDQYGFNYNNIGNRITANENETNKSYTTNSLNQYTHNTGFSPMYDLDGNQTQIKTTTGIWNITYNGENRPVKFIQGNTFISMNYDYMGRRFEKIVIGEGNIETSQKFMYDDYLQIEELNGNNESIKSYLWDPIAEDASRPLMLTDHALEQSFFFTHDANKNVTDLIDEGGMVVVHYEYSPFGVITLNTNPSFDNSFTFSSEYFDSELGLIYYNYRHYNPWDGRWTSRDPIEESGGYNLYGMCVNNIENICDVLGYHSCPQTKEFSTRFARIVTMNFKDAKRIAETPYFLCVQDVHYKCIYDIYISLNDLWNSPIDKSKLPWILKKHTYTEVRGKKIIKVEFDAIEYFIRSFETETELEFCSMI